MPTADSRLSPDAQSSSKLSRNELDTRVVWRQLLYANPRFPRGYPEISTALPQPVDIRDSIARRERPISEPRAVALHAPITPILLCYDETGRKSSEIRSGET